MNRAKLSHLWTVVQLDERIKVSEIDIIWVSERRGISILHLQSSERRGYC